jgi:hypothetical protein
MHLVSLHILVLVWTLKQWNLMCEDIGPWVDQQVFRCICLLAMAAFVGCPVGLAIYYDGIASVYRLALCIPVAFRYCGHVPCCRIV